MALFCIILIVISSVLEINALGVHVKPPRPVSKSPRQTFHPQKVTVHVT